MTLAKADTEKAAGAKPDPGAEATAERTGGWFHRHRTDLLVTLGYLVGAVVAMKHLLFESTTQISSGNTRGQAFAEWMLVHGARVVTHGDTPFFSDRMNLPDGVNPLAMHGFLGLSIPLAPVTLLIGPARTYAVATTLCLVATAVAWYYLLSRHLVHSRSAAVLGGALGGLGPAMISHAQGDLARVALFLVPFLIWWTVRLREPGRAVRNGLVLGLLATWQLLIDEEVLLLVAFGWVVFLIAYGVQRRDDLRRDAPAFLRGLGVAAGTCAVLVAYPVWVQFANLGIHWGPTAATDHNTDVFAFFAFPSPSLGTWPVGQLHYAKVGTEQNAFYGWPLLMLLLGSLWILRTALVRALVASGCVLAFLSLGSELMIKGRATHVPGPWRLLAQLPGFRSLPPTDLAIMVLPIAVLVLALIVQWGGRLISEIHAARPGIPVRIAWYGVLVAALLPLAPAPIHTTTARLPAFIANGAWRSYVPEGSSLMTVVSGATGSSAFRWAVSTNLELAFAGGDLGPVVSRAAGSGKAQKVTDRDRTVAFDALRHGRVAAVVMVPQRNEDALRNTTSSLLGFYPRWVDGVWLWDLRTVV
jgi:hypothetical protein